MTTQTLKGQRFLVVGGSSGIGLAIAAAAMAAGAEVTIASRSKEKLDAALCTLGEVARAAVLDTVMPMPSTSFSPIRPHGTTSRSRRPRRREALSGSWI